MIKQYRKKPVVIEAMQWDGEQSSDIVNWIYSNGGVAEYRRLPIEARIRLYVITREGHMEVPPKGFVIRGIQGEFYPCQSDIFEASYDDADDPEEDPVAALAERLRRAESTLECVLDNHRTLAEKVRLKGKIEGVSLALGYIEEMSR